MKRTPASFVMSKMAAIARQLHFRWTAILVVSLATVTTTSDAQTANPRFSRGWSQSGVQSQHAPRRKTRSQYSDGLAVSHEEMENESLESEALNLERARQALRHGPAFSGVASQIPSFYRPMHERLIDYQAPEPIPLSEGSDESMEPTNDPFADQPEEVPVDEGYLGPEGYSEEMEGDGPYYEDEYYEDESYDDSCCADICTDCCCVPWYKPIFCRGNTQFLLGVAGFKNPVNQGRDGSFGFQQGINLGLPLPILPRSGIGWQVGFRTIQANIAAASFTDEQRQQTFFTTGLFRRNLCGWQGGIVFDLLKDKWYADLKIGQIRGELSYRFPQRHEWGFWYTAGDSVDNTASPVTVLLTDEWTPTNVYAFYYRRRLCWCDGGTTRIFAGFSENQDAFVGGDAFLPLNHRWALQSSVAYLGPDEPNFDGGNENEAWNLSTALVWTFGGHGDTQFRPMFDVADNGSFFLDRDF